MAMEEQIISTTTSREEGIYPIRTWELNDNSTRYDKLVAAPSDDDLEKQWLGWVFITAVVALFTGTLLLSIVTHKTNRRKPFNVYLIYLIIPDFIFSFFCFITCLLNFLYGSYYSELMCKFQAIYCVFGIGSNAWLNAVVTFELRKMLKTIKLGQHGRYVPPTTKVITLQAAAVYLYILGLGVVTVTPFVPVNQRLITGLACLPADFSHMSSVVFYLIFLPLFAVIPVMYVAYAAYDIYRHDLLPKTGKSRLQAFFFGRLIVVYLIFWIPSVLFIFILSPWANQWIAWVSGGWSHLQGLVSAIVSLMKPDLAEGFKDFLCCRCNNYMGNKEDDGTTDAAVRDGKARGDGCKEKKKHVGQVSDFSIKSYPTSKDMSSEEMIMSIKSNNSALQQAKKAAYPGIGGFGGRRVGNDDHHEPPPSSKKSPYKQSFKRIDPTGCIVSDDGSYRLSSSGRHSSTASLLNSLTICSVNEDTREGFIKKTPSSETNDEDDNESFHHGDHDEESSQNDGGDNNHNGSSPTSSITCDDESLHNKDEMISSLEVPIAQAPQEECKKNFWRARYLVFVDS